MFIMPWRNKTAVLRDNDTMPVATRFTVALICRWYNVSLIGRILVVPLMSLLGLSGLNIPRGQAVLATLAIVTIQEVVFAAAVWRLEQNAWLLRARSMIYDVWKTLCVGKDSGDARRYLEAHPEVLGRLTSEIAAREDRGQSEIGVSCYVSQELVPLANMFR